MSDKLTHSLNELARVRERLLSRFRVVRWTVDVHVDFANHASESLFLTYPSESQAVSVVRTVNKHASQLTSHFASMPIVPKKDTAVVPC